MHLFIEPQLPLAPSLNPQAGGMGPEVDGTAEGWRVWKALSQNPAKVFDGIGEADVVAIVDEASESQFDALRSLMRLGESIPDRFACIALAGKKFHGNRNRPWQALRGNLHFCGAYKIDLPVRQAGQGLSMIPAIAVCEVGKYFGVDPSLIGIKWVNDILIDDKKVSGVLTSTVAKGDVIERVLFGVGVNVGVSPQLEPGRFSLATTCLSESIQVEVGAVLWRLLHELNHWLAVLIQDGVEAIHSNYVASSMILNREVEVWSEDGDRKLCLGCVKEILPDLNLIIEGEAEPIRSGRIILL